MLAQITCGLAGLLGPCVVGVIIYVLLLLGRFVTAHQKLADAQTLIARKMRDEDNR
jgi:hypothetical protein